MSERNSKRTSGRGMPRDRYCYVPEEKSTQPSSAKIMQDRKKEKEDLMQRLYIELLRVARGIKEIDRIENELRRF